MFYNLNFSVLYKNIRTVMSSEDIYKDKSYVFIACFDFKAQLALTQDSNNDETIFCICYILW